MQLLQSLQSDQRHPQCVVVLLLAVVQELLVVHKQVHRVSSQVVLLRLPAAQHLLQRGYKRHKAALQVVPQKACVLQVREPAVLVLVDQAVQAVRAERRSHRHRFASSHSWVTCSCVDQSM